MKHKRISDILEKIETSYRIKLMKITALQKYTFKMDLSTSIENSIIDQPRRTKHKHRHILTDDEIKEDLDAINMIDIKYEKVYKIGDKVKVLNGDESFVGEVVKIDQKDFIVKTKGGERVKMQMLSIKNGDIKVTKI